MIFRFLKHLLDDHTDPAKHCEVHKTEGCAHVDGFLCNMATCEILKEHRAASIQSDTAQKEGGA